MSLPPGIRPGVRLLAEPTSRDSGAVLSARLRQFFLDETDDLYVASLECEVIGIDRCIDKADPHAGRAIAKPGLSGGPADHVACQAVARDARGIGMLLRPEIMVEVDHRLRGRGARPLPSGFQSQPAGNAKLDHLGVE